MGALSRSRLLALLAGAAVASAALGAWLWRPSAAVAPQGRSVGRIPPRLRIAHAPVVLNLPLFVALDRGWFAEAELAIERIPFTTANDMINALAAGRVDAVSGVSVVPLLHLEASAPGRVHLVLHSRMTAAEPYDAFVVAGGSPVRALADLDGRRLGAYPGTTATNLVRAFLRRKGIDAERVTVVQLPPAGHISALESGAIDVLFAYEPVLSTVLMRGGRLLHGSIYADLLSPSPISAAVVSRAYARAQPEAARRFAAVLDRAVRELRRDPGVARGSLARHLSLSAEVAARVAIVPDTLSTEVDVENLQAFIDLLVEIGELGTRVSAASLVAEDS